MYWVLGVWVLDVWLSGAGSGCREASGSRTELKQAVPGILNRGASKPRSEWVGIFDLLVRLLTIYASLVTRKLAYVSVSGRQSVPGQLDIRRFMPGSYRHGDFRPE